LPSFNTEQQKSKIIAIASVLLACFFWAISFIASKEAVAIVPPLTVVTIRLGISSLCFFGWFLLSRKLPRWHSPLWFFKLFLLSLCGTSLHYATQTAGLAYTAAANASLYAAMAPITILVTAWLMGQDKFSLRKTFGILLALLGAITVTGWQTILKFELTGSLYGDILVFFSIVLWGLFTVFGKEMIEKTGVLETTALVTFIGFFSMIPLSAYEVHGTLFEWQQITTKAWLAMIFLGVTCSFIATILYFTALKKMESQQVGVFLYTIPPMTSILSSYWLGEVIGVSLVAGSILVLTGVWLTEHSNEQHELTLRKEN
jgi:drug/metabolite transporter (DMT)-like permease